ncbi:hypothetical protein [Saccharothrix longispora]|uniref:hypothetical protein n=1 Tax=Saccharothrix longispora TaxID=33920 RepID=UPI0028FD91F7|nr:hypothetical protein [Saccharothrix longispora]MBY8849036.1 hypothetical protein [Saccharothrix sp. MB29]MDU0290535.1 hypothetical protein [Saccharothrix longispora]
MGRAGLVQSCAFLRHTGSTGGPAGDLRLDPTTGRFTVRRSVPVRAEIESVQEGRTSGTLAGVVLKSTSDVTVKLPHVTVPGIPVSTSRNCATRTPASIPLESKPGSDPLAGGTPAGTYTMPALKGRGRDPMLLQSAIIAVERCT